MVEKQGNNLEIFGPFSDLQEFFKNRGLSLRLKNSHSVTYSASYDLKKFRKKIKIAKVILKSHIIAN